MLTWPDLVDREFSVIACPRCLAEGAAQRTKYAMNTDRYVCLIHGPVVTGEFLHALRNKTA